MVFHLDPWQLEVDVESTKQFYEEMDLSVDKEANRQFVESLSPEHQRFFDLLGVDLMKTEISKTIYDMPQDGEMPALKMDKMWVNFLLRGNILAVPQYQKDLYSDEEVFGKEFPDSIKVFSSKESDYIKTFENGIGAGMVFKHPCFHYDDSRFKQWDCGYILGTILVMRPL